MVESIKIITRQASMRVAKYAFLYAQLHGRKRVSAIHKANIMKKTDGLFLEVKIAAYVHRLYCRGAMVYGVGNSQYLNSLNFN